MGAVRRRLLQQQAPPPSPASHFPLNCTGVGVTSRRAGGRPMEPGDSVPMLTANSEELEPLWKNVCRVRSGRVRSGQIRSGQVKWARVGSYVDLHLI